MGKTGKLLAALVILSAGILLPMHTDAKEVEVQTEVLEHRFFDGKHINDYNVHVFEKASSRGSVSFYRGLTVMRGQGWRTVNGDHRSSKAFGLGPAFMARWEKPIGGNGRAPWKVPEPSLPTTTPFPTAGGPSASSGGQGQGSFMISTTGTPCHWDIYGATAPTA